MNKEVTFTKDELIRITNLQNAVEQLQKEIETLEAQQRASTFSYFMRRNWWKLGAFLIAVATIFGAIGDVVYHLLAPK